MKKDRQKKYIHKIMDLKYESIIAAVSMIFIFLAFFFTGSYQASRDLQRTIVYGKHNGTVVNADADETASIQLSNITNKQTIDFMDDSQQVEEIYRNYYSSIITILGIMVFAFVFSLILIVQNQKTYIESIRSRIRLFSEFGLRKKRYSKDLF